MSWLNFIGVVFVARFLLVILFPFSALDKIINYKAALAQACSSFLPGGRFLLLLSIAVETVAPLCILFAWHDRLAAFILAGFCLITALLYHPFWAFPDFWKAGDSVGRNHLWDFLKNLGLAGGLLLVVLLGSLQPASSFIHQPLSSTFYGASPE